MADKKLESNSTNNQTEEIIETDVQSNPEEVTNSDSQNSTSKCKSTRFLGKTISNIFPKKGDSKRQITLKITAIVSALAILFSGGYLVYYFNNLGVQNQVINQQRAIYDLNRYDYNTETSEGYLAKFSELKRQNKDLIGWITIEGTEVDNPIYQRDNEYYLNHDMNGKSNSYGSLFLDERCDVYPSRRTRNQIIYGHNMRYGAMFGTLDEYRDIEYYKQHPTIIFDSLWEHNVYKIFAIMITSDVTDDTFGYEFSPYRADIRDTEDFLLWTEYCKQRSLIDTNVDIEPDDAVITLSTCCKDFDEARLVIVGRLVREGESTDVDVNGATVNKDCIYPKKYYDKKKLPVPKVEPPTVSVNNR